MRYASILPNDVTNGEGICVSLFTQGCPHHCKGCFNPETWNFDEGKPYTNKEIDTIIKLINKNEIQRNFCILGGEPFISQNLNMLFHTVKKIRETYPTIKIFLWTGYTFDYLQQNELMKLILNQIDVLIDGPFIEEEKDLSLRLRGSRNQHIYKKINGEWKLNE